MAAQSGGLLYESVNSGTTFTAIGMGTPTIYYPFENSVTDVMGGTPTVTGSPGFVTGVVGSYALNLANPTITGTPTQYIRQSINLTSTPNFTLSFWFNVQATPTGQTVVMELGTSSTESFTVCVGTTTIYVQYLLSGGWSSATVSSSLSINTWYNITIIYAYNGTSYIYLNNALALTFSVTTAFQAAPNLLSIGTYSSVLGGAFKGYIDDVRFYTSAVTFSPIVPMNWTSTAMSSTGQYQLAAATTGGLFLSSNYGSTWTMITSVSGWGSIAVSASGQYMFGCSTTANYAPYYSTNYGVTWTNSTFEGLTGSFVALSGNGQYSITGYTTTARIVSNYLAGYTTASYTTPTLPSINANIVTAAISGTGQYMVIITQGTTNNVYYSTNYGSTFSGTTIGALGMTSCAISYDGSYIIVSSATTVYTLNLNGANYSVAMGNAAGLVNQGSNAIAIGNQAGQTNQTAGSIVLNGSGSALNAYQAGLFVAPVATTASSSLASVSVLGYGSDNQVTQTSVTVLANGAVGINTTSPQASLHVQGNTLITNPTVYNLGAAAWYIIGYWDCTAAQNMGAHLKVRLIGCNGYGAPNTTGLNSGGETTIYLTNLNNGSTSVVNIDGVWKHEGGYPPLAAVKVVQNGSSRYQYYVYANVQSYTQHAISAETTQGTVWTTQFTSASDPGSNSSTVQLITMSTVSIGANVGIGTTNPTYPLHVVGSINLTGSILYNGSAITTGTGSIWNTGSGGVAYYSGGNVGIGTATPAAKLSVIPADGTTNYGLLSFINSSGYGIYVNTTAISSRGNTMDWYAYDYNFGTITAHPILTMRPEGLLGIGTTSPAQLLHVYGDGARIRIDSTTANNSVLELKTGTNISYLFTDQSGNLEIYPYTTSKNILLQPGGGNVGIGTNAPITNLHVRVATYSTPIFIVDAGGQGTDSTTVPRGIGKPLIGIGANSWSNVSSGDYYGIGFGYTANNNATSYYPAEIGFLVQSTSGGEYGDMVFSTRATTTATTIASERMRITSGGNVGIGTNSPSYPLQVTSVVSLTYAISYYYGGGGQVNYGGANATNNTSLYITGWGMTAAAWGVTSDRRIKKNIQPVSSMLSIIDQINVVKYDYIDPRLGREECSVIAQELNDVFPNAINVNTDYIPNILNKCTHVNHDGIITLSVPLLSNPDNLKDITVGSSLKLMLSDNDGQTEREFITPILSVSFSDNTITITSWNDYMDSTLVVVYGTQVNDFLSIDKPQLGVMALQGVKELHQVIQRQQNTIDTLQTQLNQMMTRLSAAGL